MPGAERDFTPLDVWLRSSTPAAPGARERSDAQPETAVSYLTSESAPGAGGTALLEPDIAAVLREARRFGAALADAVEALAGDVLRRLAVDVLARELHAAPADLPALVRRLVGERLADEPLRLYVAPLDVAAATPAGIPVEPDSSLAAGDAVLVCRSGCIDARLGVRLATVLREALG